MEDCTRLDIMNAGNLERKNLTKQLSKQRETKSDVWRKELKSKLSSDWRETANGMSLDIKNTESNTKLTIKKDTTTNLYGFSISCNTSRGGKNFSSGDLTKTITGIKDSINQIVQSLSTASLSCTHEINLIKSKKTSTEHHADKVIEEHISTENINTDTSL
tara:strand:+ start:28 stop:510 length:483 start_codon:yes stop_codon:yes gene_type:complete